MAEISRSVQQIRADYNTWIQQTAIVLQSPLLLSQQLFTLMVETGGIMYDAVTAGIVTIDSYVNFAETMDTMVRQALATFGIAIGRGGIEVEAVIEEDAGMDFTDPVNPEPEVHSSVFQFVGFLSYTVKHGDILLSIALNVMGDARLWPFIVSANPEIRTSADLVAGERIFVPIPPSQVERLEGFIISADSARNPYGADLRLDENGAIVMGEGNDASLISGVDNVIQAANLALATPVGSLLSQTMYGLAAQLGVAGTEQALSYARMSVEATLIRDPRIEAVNNVLVTADRDTLIISADLTLIGRDESLPIRVVTG